MNERSTRYVELRAEMAAVLWDIDATSCRARSDGQSSDMKVYTVVTITALMMALVVAEGSSFFPMVSVGVGTGVLLSLILLVADKHSFAATLMKWISGLG